MRYRAVFFFVFVVATLSVWGQRQPGREGDLTLSPYFFVQGGDPGLDRLPLESTSVEARIAAMFAEVTVHQVYKNRGDRTLEAIYVFPASTRAAVHGMRLKIGERTIVAEIREREQARQEYRDAVGQGRAGALLEQDRPNLFQMKVGNILPGDRIEAELDYSELLEPSSGVYEFVYPTVVGPRYSTTSGATATPYTHAGEPASYRIDISIDLAAGMPIQAIECPSHRVQTKFNGTDEVALRLDPAEAAGGNRDFILRYRLAGDGIASGLMVEEGGRENHFLLMLQPPQRIEPEAIAPREYIFVIDVSGSMQGFPHETSIELLRKLVGGLRPSDSFNILFFAGESFLLSESSLPASPANLDLALRQIDSRQTGGGTELLPALRRAMTLPKGDKKLSRSILVITDGLVDVEREVFQLIRDHLGESNVFTFGIGSSVNRHLIEGMARAGWGQAFGVTDRSRAAEEAERFRKYVSAPVLTDIRPVFGGFDAYDLEPPQIPDLFAERPIVILGKWRGGSGKIGVEGLSTRGVWKRELAVKSAWRVPKGILGRLWARRKLALLADYADLEDETTKKAVTELGLRYSLLTKFTSFVAIDTVIRAGVSEPVRVVQPLPLPQGIEDSAIGAAMAQGGSGLHQTVALDASQFANPTMAVQVDERSPGTPGGAPENATPGELSPNPANAPPYLRIGGNIAASHLRRRVEPVWPELAKRARVQGIVLLQVTIDAQGNVEEVRLLRGHPLLNEAAIDAVKQWKYDPVRLNGAPVAVITTVTVDFKLK